MASSATLRSVQSDANAQLRELRSQVDQLMRDKVSPAMGDAASRAQDYANDARQYARDKTEVLSSQVKDMPIGSVLIAAAVGYLLGRLTR